MDSSPPSSNPNQYAAGLSLNDRDPYPWSQAHATISYAHNEQLESGPCFNHKKQFIMTAIKGNSCVWSRTHLGVKYGHM